MRERFIAKWLAPTISGCLGAAWIAITLLAWLGPTEPLLGNRLWNWIIAMVAGTVIALGLAGGLLLTDLVLFALGLRALPIGRRAVWMSAAAPILVGISYELNRPGDYGNPVAWVAAIVAPMAVVGVATRLLLGTKPE